MRAIYTQFSGLAGLLAFLNQLWGYAPVERSIVVGFGTGLVVYLLLLFGDFIINRILAHTPSELADESSALSAKNDASSSMPDAAKNEEKEHLQAKAA